MDADQGAAIDRPFQDLAEGVAAEWGYTISEEVHAAFCALSGDVNPLHTDDAYAREAGFEGRVVHGSLLNAFLSHFVGMVLPGRRSLLLSAELRYLAPSYVGDLVAIKGVIRQRVESEAVVVLGCEVENRTRGRLVARARAQVKVQGE
jgi:acyl dehydratase